MNIYIYIYIYIYVCVCVCVCVYRKTGTKYNSMKMYKYENLPIFRGLFYVLLTSNVSVFNVKTFNTDWCDIRNFSGNILWFGFVWFYGKSNIEGFLMSNPVYKYIFNIYDL